MIIKRFIIMVVVMFLCILAIPDVYAADILKQIHPYISVRGAYSDNLDLTRDNKKGDFYATISPGVRFSNLEEGPESSGIDLDASVGFVFYNNYSERNYISGNANLLARYLTSSHFNFYIRNAFIRSDDPREREFLTTTRDNRYVLSRETERHPYWRNIVEPVVEYQFGEESRIGVRYRNNFYSTDNSVNSDSIENYVSPFVTYWFNQQHGISIDYGYTNGYFESAPDLNGHRVNGAYMYRFTPRATASLRGAYIKQTFNEDLWDYNIYETAVGISYVFSPTLRASAEVGYYWQNPESGENNNGPLFSADITQLSARTTYRISVQGGYTQDLFTSQNLGFQKYYRATGSITHFLDQRLSIGCLGSVERVEYLSDRRDTIWGAGANIAYQPLQWLRIALEYTYIQDNTNYPYQEYEYKENRGMLTVTATY